MMIEGECGCVSTSGMCRTRGKVMRDTEMKGLVEKALPQKTQALVRTLSGMSCMSEHRARVHPEAQLAC